MAEVVAVTPGMMLIAVSPAVPDAPLTFLHPAWLLAVLVTPLIALLAWRSASRAARVRRMFGASAPPALGRAVRLVLRAVSASALSLAIVAIAAGLARPRTDPTPIETEFTGRDIIFVVDVSRSMLAEDLAPNRLERAKLWIRDLAADRPTDRVALVAYAGVAQVLSPLSLDRLFFDEAINELSPAAVSRGGTMIGDAIRKAMTDVASDANLDATDIILITDGEDQGSLPLEAAAVAGEQGVRIITLGLGSTGGVTIPDPDGPGVIRSRGTPVRSALDASQLAEIARQTEGGSFLNVGTGTIRLERVYADLTRGLDTTTTGSTAILSYREWFVWPLVTAFVLLVCESLLPKGARS